MDLRAYYGKIRELEASLKTEHVVVVSNPTPDGGKAGVMTLVTKFQAAKLVTDGRVRLATEAEQEKFYKEEAEKLLHAQSEQVAGELKITVLSPDTGVSTTTTARKPKG